MTRNRKRFFAVGLAVILMLCGCLTAYAADLKRHACSLPVLMYHNLAEAAATDYDVTPETFEAQMWTIAEEGWHSVTVEQLVAWVDGGNSLPEHPVLITFDDGYASNLEYGAPILEKYGLHAVIFVIGINAGREFYVHTGEQLQPPRFALEDTRPWLESGVIELGSHTWDLHQSSMMSPEGRDGVLRLKSESREEYEKVLAGDVERERELFQDHLGIGFQAMSYPFGLHDEEAERIVKSEGIRLTCTSEDGPNLIWKGNPESLHLLNRYTITEHTTREELLGLLNWKKRNIMEKVLRRLGAELF